MNGKENTYNALNHLAIIMDGNSRWATQNNQHRFFGYSEGAKNAKEVLKWTINNDIKFLSLYALSSENFARPKEDIDHLMHLFECYIDNEFEEFQKHNIKFCIIGNLSVINENLVKKINHLMDVTKNNTKLTLYLAINYGGRNEILEACKKAIANHAVINNYNDFHKFFDYPEMPDVDFIIRTGGDLRISNFLLVQAAYAELYFTNVFWPGFTEKDFSIAIKNFYQRKRNFGKLR